MALFGLPATLGFHPISELIASVSSAVPALLTLFSPPLGELELSW